MASATTWYLRDARDIEQMSESTGRDAMTILQTFVWSSDYISFLILKTPYQPLELVEPSLSFLKSRTYREFIMESTVGAGVRLLLQRHREISTADWPFIDTKFNPNTGRNLTLENYDRLYPWLLGRGLESLHLHLPVIEQLGLPSDSETFAKNLFPELISNMTEAVMRLLERYEGCLPFLVDRSLQIKGEDDGVEHHFRPGTAGPGDIFCAKGLLLNESFAIRDIASELLLSIATKIENGNSHLGGSRRLGDGLSHGMRMLFLAVPKLTTKTVLAEGIRTGLFSICKRFIEFVLSHHFDSEKSRFSEYIHPTTGVRGSILDPGHSTEFVGFSFSAMRIMAFDEVNCGNEEEFFSSAKKVLPLILKDAMRLGFQETVQGMVKAVDNQTGEILNAEMPWWSLPETMRAALYAALNADNSEHERDCLVIFARCHNAYFRCYLNQENMLFPYQTRCGKTGVVLDSAPAIPEGDPLYHSNLCFLEILELLDDVQA